GFCYNNSRGVAKNLDEAFKWFKKSAEQGNAEAQYNVGVFYHNGYSVSQNYNTAIEWYRKAISGGYTDAQNNLDICLAEVNKKLVKPSKNTRCKICNVKKNDNEEVCSICRKKYQIDDNNGEEITLNKGCKIFKSKTNTIKSADSFIITTKKVIFSGKKNTTFIPLGKLPEVEFIEGQGWNSDRLEIPGVAIFAPVSTSFTKAGYKAELLALMDRLNNMRKW
ncbi:MAG: tetratricopeptide repeat protein, partial [Clostridia bacterium]